MRKLTRGVVSPTAIALVMVMAAPLVNTTGTVLAAPSGDGTRVALSNALRRCDGSRIDGATPSQPAYATADTLIRTGANSVVADVQLVDTQSPGTHYDVGLIEVPRPSWSTCGPGDPGTAFGGLDTDAGGRGATTLQAGIQPGATGVWVVVQRPNPKSQTPTEYYTSDFVAPI
ncbi:hypothetical protein [Mycobacterium noviomagense]|nr:hypothetical protein [Mycobacterium noviomagense]ORB12615.1 hypothetical protein BST37_15755 [Mycobacterium noviomagense]